MLGSEASFEAWGFDPDYPPGAIELIFKDQGYRVQVWWAPLLRHKGGAFPCGARVLFELRVVTNVIFQISLK